MLARYQMLRGKRPEGDPLPERLRMDTRKHTKHVLRPEAAEVERFLRDVNDASFARFEHAYLKLLAQRFKAERVRFDEIAEAATQGDVYLGCSCPTAHNPNVAHCHTVLALRFMKQHYPHLRVVLPKGVR